MNGTCETKNRFTVALAVAVAVHLLAYAVMPQPRYAAKPKAPPSVQLTLVALPPEPVALPPQPAPKLEPPPPKPEVKPVAVIPPKVEPQPVLPEPPRPEPPKQKPKVMRVAKAKPVAKPVTPAPVPPPVAMEAPSVLTTAIPSAAPGNTAIGLPVELSAAPASDPALVAAPIPSEKDGESSFVPPAYCRCQYPKYPADAKRQRQQGTVLLRLRLNERGQVEFVSVKDSSGHPSLDVAAEKAVKTWLFEPARRNGNPVPHEVEVPVKFALQN